MTKNRPTPPGIIDRIEAYLIQFEEDLLAQGVESHEASRKVDDMEKRIHEEMDSHPVSRGSILHLEELLERLYPKTEEKVAPLFESFPSGPALPEAPRYPRVTWFALAWAITFILMLGLIWLPDGILEDNDPSGFQKLMVNLIVTFGVLAPIGTTALGMVALRQIHFGRGLFLGDHLAMGLTLFFPTILFSIGVGYVAKRIASTFVVEGLAGWIALLLAMLFAYFFLRLQRRLLGDWFHRIETRGSYWMKVGDIPPSSRPSRFNRD